MTNQLQESFPDVSTRTHMRESGLWQIDVDVPAGQSPLELNKSTNYLVQSFLTAFRGLCRVVSGHYDILTFDSSRKVLESEEVQPLRLAKRVSTNNIAAYAFLMPDQRHDGHWLRESSASSQPNSTVLVDELAVITRNKPNSCFTALFLDCDTHVFIPDAQGQLHREWVPNSALFYVGYVLEPQDDDPDVLEATGGMVSFQTSIDVWVERTRDPKKPSLQYDNSRVAKRNQPLLEQSLTAWEQSVEMPITEWHSRYYDDQIVRYGFKLHS